MSRPLRINFAGALYHVTSRGNCREAIFINDQDRAYFNSLLGDIVSRLGWRIHAWCQMTNHYHLLVETPVANLSRGMRQLNGNYAGAFNRAHRRTGHVFQGRFQAVLVQRESHLLELSRYVVLNPVRAGIVCDAGEWRWSSYRQTATLERPEPWAAPDAILGLFGSQRRVAAERYIEFVSAGISARSPWRSLRNGIFLGDEKFVASSLAHNKIESRIAEIPSRQTQRTVKTLEEWAVRAEHRDDAIVDAYRSGAYTLREIGDYFGLHYSRISRIVSERGSVEAKRKT